MPLYADDELDVASGAIFLLYGVLILVVRIFGARLPDRLGGRRRGHDRAGRRRRSASASSPRGRRSPGSSSARSSSRSACRSCIPRCLLLALARRDRQRARVGRRHVLVVLRPRRRASARSSAARSSRSPATAARSRRARSPPCSGSAAARAVLGLRASLPRSRGPVAVPAASDLDRGLTMPSLLVTNDFPPKLGGIQSYLYELWRRLPPDETTVLTTPYAGAAAWDAAAAVPGRARRAAKVLLPTPAAARRDIDALAREVGADVIFLDPMLPLGLLGPRLDAPRRTSSSRTAPRSPATGACPVTRRSARRVLRGAAGGRRGRAVSGRARRSGPRAGRCRASSIPPGVDVARFRPVDDDDARAHARALRPRSRPPARARRVAARAAQGLRRRDRRGARRSTGVQLAIGGARPRPAAARTARRGGRRAVPRPRPRRRPRRRSTACADVFAMCCRDRWGGLEAEGFGIVFLEAAACGVPAVAGRSGGSHEAVVDGETGFVVAPRDVDAVRAAIDAAARRRPALRRARWASAARAPRGATSSSYDRLVDAAGAARRGRPLGACDRSPRPVSIGDGDGPWCGERIVAVVVGDRSRCSRVVGVLDVARVDALDRRRARRLRRRCSCARCRSGSTRSGSRSCARAAATTSRSRASSSCRARRRPTCAAAARRVRASDRRRARDGVGQPVRRARADAAARPRRPLGRAARRRSRARRVGRDRGRTAGRWPTPRASASASRRRPTAVSTSRSTSSRIPSGRAT